MKADDRSLTCVFVDLGRHFGGAENYLISVIDGWMKQGNKAVIISKKGSIFEKKARAGFPDAVMIGVGLMAKDISRVKKFLLYEKNDVIHINGINSGVFIDLTGSKIPRITTVHSNADMDRSDKPFLIRRLFVMLEDICLRKSDMIIAVSDVIKELLINRGIDRDRIRTICNGINVITYPDRDHRMEAGQILRVCFVGRLEKVKGCGYLLKAISTLKSLDIRCDIYGEGSMKNELEKNVKEIGISDKVGFKGFSANVRGELPRYDVIVLPSLYEAFPLTILEAMNAEVIVVCSNVGGLPAVIKNNENGYIFESGDHDQLASLLKDIYEHPDKQISVIKTAKQDLLDKYTQEIMLEKTYDAIVSAALRRSGSKT